ncbi:MAG: cytochrome c [Opitutaceae bacterium]|nr:cytochrome c [Opitutaceae bacterium]
MRNVYLITLFVCVALASIFGLRGTTFTRPPMDVFPEWAFPGMKYQPKLRPQGASTFFADGRADRVPPAHTVARGMLRDDDQLYLGKDDAGGWVKGFPAKLSVDRAFIEHGRERYTIYCAPCHSELGDGNGITKRYGMGATPTYHDDRLRNMAEGEIYNTITNGKNTMLSYADKLAPDERWAVIAYMRALQRAHQGKPADVSDPAARQTLGIQ